MRGIQAVDRSEQNIQAAITGIGRKVDIMYTREMGQEKVKDTKTWVTGKEIMKVTGWDTNAMRRAREYHWLKFKKEKKGTWRYLLESLPDRFIINHSGVINSSDAKANN